VITFFFFVLRSFGKTEHAQNTASQLFSLIGMFAYGIYACMSVSVYLLIGLRKLAWKDARKERHGYGWSGTARHSWCGGSKRGWEIGEKSLDIAGTRKEREEAKGGCMLLIIYNWLGRAVVVSGRIG
jgi:hypothetical protein